MLGISLLSSATTALNSVLLPQPSPPALLHRHRPYASSVSLDLVELRRRFLSTPSRSAICASPRTSSPSRTKKTIRCQALGEGTTNSGESQLYQGVYGPWTVESSDVREVILYRSGLVTAAASFVLASSTAFLPDHGSSISDLIKGNLDLFYTLGACGLGLSLYLIHIYVTEIKRTLQALWLLGASGSLATYITFAQPAGKSLVEYVIENPAAIWLIGPLFASLTGLVFKEGLCYGKLEAGILTFIIPSILLGHLSGLMDDGVKVTLLGVWTALFVVFAGRKFSQPIKDDIGDKSVFMFNALPEEEKRALIEKLEQQRVDGLN